MNTETQHDPLFPRVNRLIRNLLWAAAGGVTVYVLAMLEILPIIKIAGGE